MMCTLPSPIRPGNAEPTKTPMACSDSIFPKDQTLARSTKSTLLRLYKGSITDQESASIIKPHMKSYGKKHLGLLLFEFTKFTVPDVTVAPGASVTLSVEGGVWPYELGAAEGLTVAGPQGEASMSFTAGGGVCGAIKVRVRDACGTSASQLVRSTSGRWVEIPAPSGRRCVNGTPVVFRGFIYEVIGGDMRMTFQTANPVFCRDMRVYNDAQVCEDVVGAGGRQDGCDYWPHVREFSKKNVVKNCPPENASRWNMEYKREFSCNGVAGYYKRFYQWTCR